MATFRYPLLEDPSAILSRAEQLATKHSWDWTGDSTGGDFKGSGFKGTYQINNKELVVGMDKSPFIVPNAAIRIAIPKFLDL